MTAAIKVAAAGLVLATAFTAAACRNQPAPKRNPPPGWVKVSCFPGKTGDCYGPPPGQSWTTDYGNGSEKCTTVDGGRSVCEYVRTESPR